MTRRQEHLPNMLRHAIETLVLVTMWFFSCVVVMWTIGTVTGFIPGQETTWMQLTITIPLGDILSAILSIAIMFWTFVTMTSILNDMGAQRWFSHWQLTDTSFTRDPK